MFFQMLHATVVDHPSQLSPSVEGELNVRAPSILAGLDIGKVGVGTLHVG